MSEQYTPGPNRARQHYAMSRVNSKGAAHLTDASAEFDRFIARVKRDAAREALDGYADALNRNRSAAVWGWPDFVADVREWAASNYPEETP